jgi:outer membrane cobalamin receptor
MDARAAALAFVLLDAGAVRAQVVTRDSVRPDTARHLPQVRVVAGRAVRPEAASGVVVSPAAIRTTPATNAWDIVRQTAGVEVHQQGQGPGFASNAVMRGFTSDHSTDVALFVDGVPINQPVNMHAEGYADWGVLLPEAVAAISVLKGPASPLAGNFAMGGEVRVQTLPVALGTQWSLRTGSYGDARASLVTGTVTASGGYIAAGDLQREDGWRPNSRATTEHLLANRLWTDSSGGSFSLGASGYAAQWRSPGFLTLAEFNRGALRQVVDPTDGGNSVTRSVRATSTRAVAAGTLTSLLFGRAGDWLLYLNIPPEGGIGEGAPSQTEEYDRRVDAGGSTELTHPTSFGDVMAAVDYQAVGASYDRYFTTTRKRDSIFTLLDARYLLLAPTVAAHVNLSPSLVLGLGGRLDYLGYRSHDRDVGGTESASHLVASPKLSALYRLATTLSAYASFNAGFRSADGSAGDPRLEPVREWASEIGLRADGDRYEASMALFNIDVRNAQTFNPVTLASSAQGRSRRRGAELDARLGVLPDVALFTHATVNEAKYVAFISDDGADLSGKPVFGVSRSTIEGGIDFDRRGVIGSVWTAYTGPFTPVGEPDALASAHTLLHARALVPLHAGWSLGLGVQNILDTQYAELRASGFVSPGQPRTLLVTLRQGK